MMPKSNSGGVHSETSKMNIHAHTVLDPNYHLRHVGFDPATLSTLWSADEYESWEQSEPDPDEPENDDIRDKAVERIRKLIKGIRVEGADVSRAFISADDYIKLVPDLENRNQISPFPHVDAAATADESRDRLIASFRATEERDDGPAIADRIRALDGFAEDEGVATNFDSLQWLFKFLLENSLLPTPDIVISNRGNYRTQWHKAPNKHFAIEFYPSGDVKYVCFSINPIDPEKINRAAGTATVDDILQSVMEPTRSLEWIRG